MIGLYSKGADGQMYTSSSTFWYILLMKYYVIINLYYFYIKHYSKSVYDFRETNNLFICDMVTYSTRKVLYEKIQVDATVKDSHSLNLARDDVSKGNLWYSKVRVCRFLQNWCCYYLLSNRQCDKLCPTVIDGSVLSQLSQLILIIIVSYLGMGFFICSLRIVWFSTTDL